MSAFQQKDGTGVLFRNEEKEPGSSHPDYNGSLTVNGQEFWLNAWLNKAKSGKTYMSVKVNPKQPRGQKQAPAKQEQKEEDMFDDSDEIPF